MSHQHTSSTPLRSNDPELAQLQTILNLFLNLDHDAQYRILTYIDSRLKSEWNKAYANQSQSKTIVRSDPDLAASA